MIKDDECRDIISAARAVCIMFRGSPSRWQELKIIQLEYIKNYNLDVDLVEVGEENIEDIDDEGYNLEDE